MEVKRKGWILCTEDKKLFFTGLVFQSITKDVTKAIVYQDKEDSDIEEWEGNPNIKLEFMPIEITYTIKE